MPYAVLEKEIERLDETQQNTVALFVRFLLSQIDASSDFESSRSRVLRRVADENAPQWLNDISGIVSLPSGKSDDDLVCEAIANFTNDFEDEVQYRAALAAHADIIITRDKTGFAKASMSVMTPTEFIGKTAVE